MLKATDLDCLDLDAELGMNYRMSSVLIISTILNCSFGGCHLWRYRNGNIAALLFYESNDISRVEWSILLESKLSVHVWRNKSQSSILKTWMRCYRMGWIDLQYNAAELTEASQQFIDFLWLPCPSTEFPRAFGRLQLHQHATFMHVCFVSAFAVECPITS